MSLKMYEIDHRAHDLILKFRDKNDVLGESHKMRMTTAYGLERFWGEHLRLKQKNSDLEKAEFWEETWKVFSDIMKDAGIKIPNDSINPKDKNATDAIKAITSELWNFNIDQRKIALSVLIELCDSLVWWTQRYKKPRNKKETK
jgi:hypothetical protein